MSTFYDAKNKLWVNPEPRPLSDLKTTHSQLILDLLSLHGSKIAQISADNGQKMTFNEMRLETVRIAQNLQKRGFNSHLAFGFMTDNSVHLASVLLASICIACPIVPLHTMLSKSEIIRILEKTKPTAIFCDAFVYNELNEALKSLKWDIKIFTMEGRIGGVDPIENLLIETGNENNFRPVEYKIESDIALISCSSGTTGPSKCVCLSYGHTLFVPDKCEADSVVFCDESIYWAVGIKPIIDCIHSGATRLITMKPFSPQFELKQIEQFKINVLYISAFSLTSCLKNPMIDHTDLSSIKSIIFYGSKFPSSLGPILRKYFPNANCKSWYGMTEIGRLAILHIDENGNSSGERLFNNRQVKIVDECGNRCGFGVNGELCFKLQNEFLGYLDDSLATEACIDSEGFFHTGDVGHFDENGLLYMADRIKNVLNIFYFDAIMLPSEIEDCLIANPNIQEICVVGISVATGETLPAAVIVPNSNSTLTTRDVYNIIAEKFPTRSRLRGGVYFVDSLPKTHNGKLIRRKITEMATEMFQAIKNNDPDIQSYLRDIPDEFRELI